MRDRLISLLCGVECAGSDRREGGCGYRDSAKCNRIEKLDHCMIACIADHLLANGVIVPPYKCGTVVYVLRSKTSNGKNLYLREERVDHYRTFDDGTHMIFESGRVSVDNTRWDDRVFFSREEAEQALKGGSKNDGEIEE